MTPGAFGSQLVRCLRRTIFWSSPWFSASSSADWHSIPFPCRVLSENDSNFRSYCISCDDFLCFHFSAELLGFMSSDTYYAIQIPTWSFVSTRQQWGRDSLFSKNGMAHNCIQLIFEFKEAVRCLFCDCWNFFFFKYRNHKTRATETILISRKTPCFFGKIKVER